MMKKFFSKSSQERLPVVLTVGAVIVLLAWGAWMYWNNSERRENFQDKLLATV